MAKVKILSVSREYNPLKDVEVFTLRIVVLPDDVHIPDGIGLYKNPDVIVGMEQDSLEMQFFPVRKIAMNFASVMLEEASHTSHGIIQLIAIDVAYLICGEHKDADYDKIVLSLEKQMLEIQKTKNPFVKFKFGGYIETGKPASHISTTKFHKVTGEGAKFQSETSRLSRELPGVDTWVECPADRCTGQFGNRYEGTIRTIVIHVNDDHKWPLAQIADWLDKMHDEGHADLAFKVEEDG